MTTSTSGGTGAEEEFPLPRILDPANDSIIVPVNQVGPLDFEVAGILPGITEVLIDNRVVGTLSPSSVIGELSEERLRLELSGAMLVGAHTISLVNPSSEALEGIQRSRTLTLSMVPAPKANPSASLGGALSPGAAVTVDGSFGEALLTVVEESPGEVAIAHVFAREAATWAQAPRSVELPGYVRAPDERTPPVTAQWVSSGEEGDEGRLRIAWRVGLDGSAVAGVEVSAGGTGSGEVLTLMSAPTPLTKSFEWVAYGRPRFHGGDLLVEIEALVDTEIEHPGDHRLLQLRWPPPPDTPQVPFEVASGEVMDLDALGTGVDLSDRSRPLRALRTGGLTPALVDRDPAGSARVVMGEGQPLALEADAPVDLLGIVTSLGGWTTFAIDHDGAYTLSLNDTYSVMQIEPLISGTRPEASPTAAPAVAVLGGVPLVAVPYGEKEDVHIASLDGGSVMLEPLVGVRCDALALLIEDPAQVEVPLVCILEGEARLGELSAGFE